MTMPTDVAISMRLDEATAVLSVGRLRGWPLPDTYTSAFEVYSAAQRAAAAPEPTQPAAPTTGKEVPAWISKVATARVEWRESRDVAVGLQATAVRALVDSARGVTVDYIDRLCTEFDALAGTFGQLLTSAPRTLTGHENTDQLAGHAELLRCMEAMTRAVVDRGTLAVLSMESANLGRAGLFWLYADPHHQSTIDTDGLIALTQRFRGAIPSTLDDWTALQAPGLSMARLGQAAERLDTFTAVMQYRGQADRSMGMQPSRWTDWIAQARDKAVA